MKPGILIGLCMGFVASASTVSGERDSRANIDATTLGNVDAIIAACRSVDASNDGAYKDLRASLLGKFSEDSLEGARHTVSYRNAYSEFSDSLRADPQDWLGYQCLALIRRT